MLMPFAFQQSGAVVFDPASISGLTHRYSASGAASGLSGSFVTSWTDSVSGVNMVQATAIRQPTYIASAYDFNGQPVVRFSAGRVMASASLSSVFGSASRTVFVIAKTNAIGDVTYGDNLFATDDAPISQYNANTWPYYLPKAISTRGIHGWASASSFYGEQPVSKPITIVWRHNSGTTTFRREQTTLINAAFSVSGNQGYCVVGKGMQNTGHDSDCDISEILVYNRALSDAEITQVENYAIAKYNLGSYGTLPVASPALWLDASRSDTLFTDIALTTAVTTDNGPVGGWKDLSGNNRNALQSGTNRPTWRTPINGQNGLGVMSFNGTAQWLDIASFPSLASGYTFYGVINQPTATGAVLSSASAGVDGSTAAMVAGPAVTAVGNAQVSTTNSKFGAGSALFDGSGDYLSVPASGGFNFGTGEFTIEMFFKIPVGASGSPYGKILSSNENGVFIAGCFSLYGLASSTSFRPSFWIQEFSGSTPILIPSSGDYRDNAWHHLAIVRQTGGAMIMYIDGTSVASATHTGNCGSSTRNLLIGHNLVSGREYAGGTADFRVSKVARYTSAFTPSASPLPDTAATDPYFAQTSLLLHMDGTNGSTVFTDSSNNVGTGITQGGKSLAQPVASGTIVGVIGNYDGTHTAGNYLVRTSSSAANASGIMTQTASTPATGTASIGRLTNATAYFNSQIYELVVLPRQSTTTEDTAWKTYTAAKWGITWS